MNRVLAAIVLTAILLASPEAFAQLANAEVKWEERISPLRDEIAMARPLGMGRAFIGIAEGNTGFIYNPAGVATDVNYQISLDAEIDPLFGTRAFGASIVDSATSALCAQMGYTYHGYGDKQFWQRNDLSWLETLSEVAEFQNNDGSISKNAWYGMEPEDLSMLYYKEGAPVIAPRQMLGPYKDAVVHRHVPRLSLGGAITKHVLLGVTGKYIFVKRPQRHSVNSGNMDIGFLFRTGVGLQIGLTAYNLIHTSYNLWPLKFGFGLAYVWNKELYIAVDQIVALSVYNERIPSDRRVEYGNDTLLSTRAGVEYNIMRMIGLRAGYEWDSYKENHYVSGGVSYIDKAFSFNIGYSQGIVETWERLLSVNFDFKIL